MTVRSDIGADGLSPRLGLLVLQPTPFCNIDCSYCYLSNRRSTARMSSLDVGARVPARVRKRVSGSATRGGVARRGAARGPDCLV